MWLAVLRWLLPVAALVWVIVSGLGRSLLLKRMEPRLPFRPVADDGLAGRMAGAAGAQPAGGGSAPSQWVAATHIATVGEPDLVGYSIWVIFLSLGFFTAWALANWALSDCAAVDAA